MLFLLLISVSLSHCAVEDQNNGSLQKANQAPWSKKHYHRSDPFVNSFISHLITCTFIKNHYDELIEKFIKADSKNEKIIKQYPTYCQHCLNYASHYMLLGSQGENDKRSTFLNQVWAEWRTFCINNNKSDYANNIMGFSWGPSVILIAQSDTSDAQLDLDEWRLIEQYLITKLDETNTANLPYKKDACSKYQQIKAEIKNNQDIKAFPFNE